MLHVEVECPVPGDNWMVLLEIQFALPKDLPNLHSPFRLHPLPRHVDFELIHPLQWKRELSWLHGRLSQYHHFADGSAHSNPSVLLQSERIHIRERSTYRGLYK